MSRLAAIGLMTLALSACGPRATNDISEVPGGTAVARTQGNIIAYRTCEPDTGRAVYLTNNGGVFVVSDAPECREGRT